MKTLERTRQLVALTRRGGVLLQMVVATILLIIVISISIPRHKGITDVARQVKAQSDLKTIKTALEAYKMHHGEYPPTTDTVVASYLIPSVPQLIDHVITDPFAATGKEYKYVASPNRKFFTLSSLGPDKKFSLSAISNAGTAVSSGDDPVVSNGNVIDEEDAAAVVCGAGETNCSGACVDLTTSEDHCGACGTACSGTSNICINSICMCGLIDACSAGEGCATGACIDVTSDVHNCGSVGRACSDGEVCIEGVCGTAVCVPLCDGKECGDDGCEGSCGTCSQVTTCTAGACLSIDGEACAQDEDCASGVCGGAPRVCRTTGDREIDAACGAGSDCRSGYCDGLNGRCSDGASSCIQGDDCRSGICGNGMYCVGPGDIDAPCDEKADCGSAYCNLRIGACAEGWTNMNGCDPAQDPLEQCASGVCGSNYICGGVTGEDQCTTGGECQEGYCGAGFCSNGQDGSICSGADPAECEGGYCGLGHCTHGAVGQECGSPAECAGGICGSNNYCGWSIGEYCSGDDTCQSGACSDVCVDTQNDFMHCGGVGQMCGWGVSTGCIAGECSCNGTPCSGDEEQCIDGFCVSAPGNYCFWGCRSKGSVLSEVGITVEEGERVDVLDLDYYFNRSWDPYEGHIIECPVPGYRVCYQNNNDGSGNAVILGVGSY